MRGLAEGRLRIRRSSRKRPSLLGCRRARPLPRAAIRGDARAHARCDSQWAVRLEGSGRFLLGLPARIERFALRRIVPKVGRLAAMVSLLSVVQGRPRRFAAKILPARLADMVSAARHPASQRRRLPAFTPAEGERRRVALFEGCIMPEFFGRAPSRPPVLSRAGDVIVPETQGCCGALKPTAAISTLRASSPGTMPASSAGATSTRSSQTSAGCSASMREAAS